MLGNLLPCTIACFNVRGCYTFLTWGEWCCVATDENFNGMFLRASELELETLAVKGSGVIKFSEWWIWFCIWAFSEPGSPEKIRRGGVSEIGLGTCGCLKKNS